MASDASKPPLPSNRSFGLTFAVVFTITALFPMFRSEEPRWPWFAATAAMVLVSFVIPNILTVPNRLWMRFGAILHRIMSPVVTGVIFFGVVTPTALVLKLAGKDPLKLKKKPEGKSYWIERTESPGGESMKFQF